MFIKYEHKIIRIDLNNIKYIEGMRDYVQIHLVSGKPILILITMKNLMENLPKDKFMRVHRSYIVNLMKIQSVERQQIYFDDNERIPVSDQYKSDFQKFIDKYFLQ